MTIEDILKENCDVEEKVEKLLGEAGREQQSAEYYNKAMDSISNKIAAVLNTMDAFVGSHDMNTLPFGKAFTDARDKIQTAYHIVHYLDISPEDFAGRD
jgi:hypothetical protein